MTVDSTYLAGGVALIYAVASILDVFAGRYGYGLMWVSYATANVGVILSMRGV